MSFKLVDIKHHRRGATWPDGETRICSRCRIENVRGKAAIMTAYLVWEGDEGGRKTPVGYCEEHLVWIREVYGSSFAEKSARIVRQ